MSTPSIIADDKTVDTYFSRIGYGGSARPNLDTLRALHRLHPAAIPFDNLDPLLAKPVSLADVDIDRKLIAERRGGYCFEHNLLMLRILRTLGYRAEGLGARVLWNQAEDALTPRTHMLIRIDLEGGTWIADVGFGGLTQTAPLLLEPGIEQETPHERFRFLHREGEYRSQAYIDGEWRTLYRFDLSAHHAVDYEVSNYFVSTHPASHFTRTLIAARALPDMRVTLRNDRLSIHRPSQPTEARLLDSLPALLDALRGDLDLTIPDVDAFADAVLRHRLLGGNG
jgi:N-hydroxyarylamine O-acetyltransferase